MTLLNPIWLWALAGLAIPLGIHLLSRKEGKTIRIGSIRFLSETSTTQFSSIRLNEVLLLAIRVLLVTLIVLFLAGLLLSSKGVKAPVKWVIVEKGLENESRVKNLLDSLQKNDYELRRLAVNFPSPGTDTLNQSPDYYKLSEDLAQQNVQAIIIARNLLPNFKGKRISLPENMAWLSYPSLLPSETQGLSAHLKDTIHITLVFDKDFQYDKKNMTAALKAIQSIPAVNVVIRESEIKNFNTDGNPGWIFWLSETDSPVTGNVLKFKAAIGNDLIVQESKNHWALTKRLNEENALEQHLPVQLMNMLVNETSNRLLLSHDSRTVPDELAWSKTSKAQVSYKPATGQPADKYLALLIVFVFIIERLLAFYKKQ